MTTTELRDIPTTPSRQGESTAIPRLLLTVEQAARALNIGRTTAYLFIAAGDLEALHLGRLRRVPADARPAYVDRLRNRAS